VLELLRSERIMSTTTINPHQELIEKLPPASTLILHEISWEEYEEILDALGEAKGLRVSYDQGTLQVMTLSTRHEKYARLIDNLSSSRAATTKINTKSSSHLKTGFGLRGSSQSESHHRVTKALQRRNTSGSWGPSALQHSTPSSVAVQTSLGFVSSMMRTLCCLPSSTRAISGVASCSPSSSILAIPRLRPCGFSTIRL